ncbi:hypothetical protein B0H13DRAFT_1855512 [Mycena leptocephala]|nr:hypothetical protein B0H13DRAFT_1855512 [Mycena leptocephala]
MCPAPGPSCHLQDCDLWNHIRKRRSVLGVEDFSGDAVPVMEFRKPRSSVGEVSNWSQNVKFTGAGIGKMEGSVARDAKVAFMSARRTLAAQIVQLVLRRGRKFEFWRSGGVRFGVGMFILVILLAAERAL